MKGLGAAAASAAVILVSGAGGAYAADLNTMSTKAPVAKAPVGPTTCTSITDFFTTACQLSWYGVRLYGTIDMGGSYQTNGAPFEKLLGINYFPGRDSHGAKWLLAPNAMSISNIGVQIKKPLGGGWSLVGQLEHSSTLLPWNSAMASIQYLIQLASLSPSRPRTAMRVRRASSTMAWVSPV
jgi:hypothetical protein